MPSDIFGAKHQIIGLKTKPTPVASLSENRNNDLMMHLPSRSPQLLLDAEFTDIEHLCATVQLWDLDLRPIASRALTSHPGKLIQIAAGQLSYGFCSLGTSFDQYGTSPPGMFTFVAMEPTIKTLWWRGEDHGPDLALVYRPGDEMRSVSDAGFEIQTISATPEFVDGMCSELEIDTARLEKLPLSFAIPAPALREIRHQLRSFRTRMRHKTSENLEEILRTFLGFWAASGGLTKTRRPSSRARDMALRRCFEFFDAVNTMDVSLRQLSEATHVSQRTLIYAFQERFGMSPKAFLKARQLSEARHRLKSSSFSDVAIGEIAGDLGFFHHGHFTSDYKLKFGETPTETRKQIRK